MGANKSKLPEIKDVEIYEKTSIPSTPILTPKVFRDNITKASLDPRSPSRNVARTPIELLSAAAEKLQTLNLEETEIDSLTCEKMFTPLKTHIMLGIDPRSPTVEIQRTPIVVSASPDKKLPDILKNKNLDRVKKSGLLDTPKTHVPPKLLGSAPVTPKPIKPDESKRKSFVGLLETNMDFTETDLDTVLKEKYPDTCNDPSSVIVNDPRSPTIDFIRTPLLLPKTTEEVEASHKAVDDNVHSKENQTSTSEDIEVSENIETPENILESSSSVDDLLEIGMSLLVPEIESLECNPLENNVLNVETNSNNIDSCEYATEISPESPDNEVVATSDENYIFNIEEPKCVKSAPITPPHENPITPRKSKSQPVSPPIIDLTADAKELDKKLTNLIYEDEDLVVCPRIVQMKEHVRIPLGVRNGNQDKNHAIKLKVSDKPRKVENGSSKIPVFKEKKIKVQCENTPPRGMKTGKSKKSQWDPKDETLII
ncbi:uncharacterized protein LOC115889486 [Sitophilus oryzae]|uniref:Uncharacterized protein LOC115889486 n=1 Tax=Sitophilus oryzae TaxID=7048 RepID=A0A6J2YRE2_SITOR|nr:uncharacterized protein LOC115889486 [Sitophilus oryzae]XP_030765351.1 uncharacterized protein LOC115889486 [Sitophilus oryzae]